VSSAEDLQDLQDSTVSLFRNKAEYSEKKDKKITKSRLQYTVAGYKANHMQRASAALCLSPYGQISTRCRF